MCQPALPCQVCHVRRELELDVDVLLTQVAHYLDVAALVESESQT